MSIFKQKENSIPAVRYERTVVFLEKLKFIEKIIALILSPSIIYLIIRIFGSKSPYFIDQIKILNSVSWPCAIVLAFALFGIMLNILILLVKKFFLEEIYLEDVERFDSSGEWDPQNNMCPEAQLARRGFEATEPIIAQGVIGYIFVFTSLLSILTMSILKM